MPGFVETKLSRKKAGFMIPTTMVAVEGALKDLGRREITYGVMDHHINGWFLRFARYHLPNWMLNMGITKEGMAAHKKLRERNHSFI